MAQPLPAYRGSDAYVFVSYAHADESVVFDEIRWLQDQGVNVWYDATGIGPGSEWNDEIAKAIKGAEQFVYLITPNSVASEHCRRELNFAQSEGRSVVAIHLTETEVPDGLRLTLDHRQAILKHRLSPGDYRSALIQSLSREIVRAEEPVDAELPGTRSTLLRGVLVALGAVLIFVTVLWYSQQQGGPELNATSQPVDDRPSIAVLPFVDPGSKGDYLAEELSAELINALSRFPGLRVAARTSSFLFKDADVDVMQIGSTLGVEHVLAGRLRQSDSSLRVSAELIDTKNGAQLWGAAFERRPNELFAIEDAIVSTVAEKLRVEPGGPRQALTLGGTTNGTAHTHYLVGRALFNTDPDRSIDELERAVEIDPNFARAWVTMSYAYGSRARNPAQSETALAEMGTAAARAIALAPDHWESQDALGWYLMARRDFLAADRAFDKQVELAGRAGVVAHPGYTQYLVQIGRHRERLEWAHSIRQIDPLFPFANSLYYLGRTEEAMAEYESTRGVRTHLGGSDPVAEVRWLQATEVGDPVEMSEWFGGTGLEGLWGTDALLEALRKPLLANVQLPRPMFAVYAIYAARHGDVDLAVKLLRAEYLRDGFAGHFLIWAPQLSSARATPAFKVFLEELGLVDMFRQTGKWNDFCTPTAGDDFACR